MGRTKKTATEKTQERRGRTRVKANFIIEYWSDNKNRQSSLTHDLSSNGLCFASENPVGKGTGLFTMLRMPQGQKPVRFCAEVVRDKKSEIQPELYEVGVKITKAKRMDLKVMEQTLCSCAAMSNRIRICPEKKGS